MWLIRSIDYRSTPYENDNNPININITPQDSIFVLKRNLKETSIIIRRTLKITPVEVFSLSIDMEVSIGFIEGVDTAEMSDAEIIQSFKENCVSALSIIMSRISLLISEITGGSGQLPIITQPILVES